MSALCVGGAPVPNNLWAPLRLWECRRSIIRSLPWRNRIAVLPRGSSVDLGGSRRRPDGDPVRTALATISEADSDGVVAGTPPEERIKQDSMTSMDFSPVGDP